MRQFTGHGGSLYAAGEPFAFTRLPLTDCGDGFTWRSGDDSVRCWLDDSPTRFGFFDGGCWAEVAASEVCAAAASVTFGRCLSGGQVYADGVGVPTSLLAEGESWELRQTVLEAVSLDGPSSALGSAVAFVKGVAEETWFPSPLRRVLAVLPSAAAGAFVGLGELVRDVSGLKVIFDNKGVTYATG